MIGHRIDRNQFLPFSCDNSGDVLLQLLATGLGNHTSAARHREHNMQIDLRVGVGHLAKPYMTLLAELIMEAFFGRYKHVAPMVLPYSDFVDPLWEGSKAPLGAQCL